MCGVSWNSQERCSLPQAPRGLGPEELLQPVHILAVEYWASVPLPSEPNPGTNHSKYKYLQPLMLKDLLKITSTQ